VEQENNIVIADYFKTEVYSLYKPESVLNINKICDTYIKNAQEKMEPKIREKNKKMVEAGLPEKDDFGMVYHSDNGLLNEPEMESFVNFCVQTACDILDRQGYDVSNHTAIFTDFWVQEFSKKGGGHHSTHIHENNHISGFYYLKCSENTSFPIFHDPRAGALQGGLPEKNIDNITNASRAIHYNPMPGTLIFFNSHLPHEYSLDDGIEDFRFIHFNIQLVNNGIIAK